MSETVARHLANRADLVAARAALEAAWGSEDAATAAARAERLAAFDRGLEDVDAVIVAAGGVVPIVEPVSEQPEQPASHAGE